MSKRLRAKRDFMYPDGPQNFKLAKAGKLAEVTNWVTVKAGAIVVEPSPELLVSWLANDVIEPLPEDKP
jgi:hypothetical protein